MHHNAHHLELTVGDTPLVLDRVVSLCRARQCTIAALHFEAADRHRPAAWSRRFEATPAGPGSWRSACARCPASWPWRTSANVQNDTAPG